jgi:hypothetical protein
VSSAKVRSERAEPAAAPSDGDDSGDTVKGDLSRRSFIKRGSLGVAAVGLVSTVPGLPGLISQMTSDGPAVDDAAADATGADAAAVTEPLVVQVRDVQSGEMSLYLGEREITYRDPLLASRILHATR